MPVKNERLFLYIGFVVALVPLLFLRDFTPANELRYLSIADEALRNHTFFTFYNHGVPYADKPPFYLWIVMALRWLLGSHQMWALALVSVVPALVTLKVMDTWVGSELEPRSRRAARLMLLTSAFFLGAAVTVRMDMLMCMFIVLALRTFWHIYTRGTHMRRAKWMFGVFVFMALFTKGPLGVLVPLCATVAFMLSCGQYRRIADVWGWRTWTVLLAGCAVWFGLVFAEGGTAYLDNLLFHQTVDRAVNAFHHNRPFHYYLVCMWYCVAPWSLLAVAAVVRTLCMKGARGSLQAFFAMTAAVTILLLSCISSKLQIYMLPAIPFMAYSAAMSLPEVAGRWWAKACLAIPSAVLGVAFVAFVCAVRLVPGASAFGMPVLYAAAAVLGAGGCAALFVLFARRGVSAMAASVRLVAAAMMASVFVGAFSLVRFNHLVGYAELCKAVSAMSGQTGIDRVAAFDVKNAEDMDVYLHRKIEVVSDETMLPAIVQERVLLVVPASLKNRFCRNRSMTVGNYMVVVGCRSNY